MGASWRFIEDKLFLVLTLIAAMITSAFLIIILGTITVNALPALDLHYILTTEHEAGKSGFGLLNAIVGSVYISVFSVLLATPVAIGTAIYLKRYATDGPLIKLVKFAIDVLSGTPSIVIGVLGLLYLALYLKSITGGYSLMTCCIAMAILIMPVIERATEDAIDTVPKALEEGSYALGAARWDTIKRITLPYAISGIVTGIVLAVGRAAEESAVVLVTASYTQFLPEYKIIPDSEMLLGFKIYPLNDPVASLPIAIYQAYEFPIYIPPENGFAAAFVLILMVLAINAIARFIIWRMKSRTGSRKSVLALLKKRDS